MKIQLCWRKRGIEAVIQNNYSYFSESSVCKVSESSVCKDSESSVCKVSESSICKDSESSVCKDSESSVCKVSESSICKYRMWKGGGKTPWTTECEVCYTWRLLNHATESR